MLLELNQLRKLEDYGYTVTEISGYTVKRISILKNDRIVFDFMTKKVGGGNIIVTTSIDTLFCKRVEIKYDRIIQVVCYTFDENVYKINEAQKKRKLN